MRISVLIFLFLNLAIPLSTKANLPEIKKQLGKRNWKKIEKNEVISYSDVENDQLKQSMKFYVAGLHRNECRIALRKISRYENYKSFINFVKESAYHKKRQQIFLKFDHTLLPVALNLRFKLERIKKPGKYHFEFEHGFFKGLKGLIHAYPENNRCFFFLEANWHGKKTGFSNTVIEIFSQTLAEIGMKRLFKMSQL